MLLPDSWGRWVQLFQESGYAPVAVSWPDDPDTVEEARANREVLAGKTVARVADHAGDVIGRLGKRPAVVGHSFGGLLAQIVAGRGLAAVSVAIDPAPFRGVLPLPLSSLRSAVPCSRTRPTVETGPAPSNSSPVAEAVAGGAEADPFTRVPQRPQRPLPLRVRRTRRNRSGRIDHKADCPLVAGRSQAA